LPRLSATWSRRSSLPWLCCRPAWADRLSPPSSEGPYGERKLSYLIGQIEHDFSHTRRLLEVKRIATRADGIFELTDLGEAMWRVEHFIRQSKLQSVQPEPSSGDRSP
jgi:hypothetical protein